MTELKASHVGAFVLAAAVGAIIGAIAVRAAERWAAGGSILIKAGP